MPPRGSRPPRARARANARRTTIIRPGSPVSDSDGDTVPPPPCPSRTASRAASPVRGTSYPRGSFGRPGSRPSNFLQLLLELNEGPAAPASVDDPAPAPVQVAASPSVIVEAPRPVQVVSSPPVKDSATMAYVVPIHKASSVRHALKLNFLDAEEECLVVAKANRLEFNVLTPDGLVCRYSKPVYGQIVMLERLRPSTATTDHLFVGTDRHMFFTLSWDATSRQLRTESSFQDLADSNGRDSQSRDRVYFDQRRRFLTLELFEGVLTILPVHTKQPKGVAAPVNIGELTGEILPVRIPEIIVRSSTYLFYKTESEKEKARIATLFEDNQERAWLKIRTLVPNRALDYAELEDEKVILTDKLDSTPTHLIPVENPVNGLLVLSETQIVWSDGEDEFVKHPLPEATIWAVWTHIEDLRWLLADEFGGLHFLMLDFDQRDGKVKGFKLHKLEKKVSSPSALVHLGGGLFYMGSHSGDSVLVQIMPGGGMIIVQTISNLGPILDLTIMDMGSRGGETQINEYSSGQARLVTGSGAWQDGSLRSVRSGVGVEEFGSIDLGGTDGLARAAVDMFHVRLTSGSKAGDLLLVSYIDDTRMFHFGPDGSVEEVQSMIIDKPTVLSQSLATSQRVLQCTSHNVTVYDEELQLISHWQVPGSQKIVAASASDDCIVVSLGGSELVTLDLSAAIRGSELKVLQRRKFDDQISCINVPNIAPQLLLVGFWQSASLAVLGLDDLADRQHEIISDDPSAVPRSVLLTQVLPGQPPTLFVALADGHVVTFSIDNATSGISNRQITILGTQQATLKILPREQGLFSVFAIAEHPTLIYGAENRLVFSAVTAEDATCICSFDSHAYPGAVAVATPTEIKIVQVERERTTHVQTLPVGESVRRIAYSPELRVFGLGTVKREIVEQAEIITSSFRLADEINFKVLSDFELNDAEVVESVCRTQFKENGRLYERFAVGTSYLDGGPDGSNGRLIIFEVTEDRMLKEVIETKLKGACRALATIDAKIVAAVTKAVVVLEFEQDSLQRKASYRTATEPIDCCVKDDHIIVSDLMKSVSILKYEQGTGGASDRLIEVARHHQIVWSTAVAPVDENTVLESDAEGNLIVLRQNVSGVTEFDQRRLETIGELRLGEMVNKIKPVAVQASPSALVVPRAFLATISGSIYLFGTIVPEYRNMLMTLQSNIAKAVKSPGDVPWEKWRAFKNQVREETEPLRFVDGELIEAFLDADAAAQEAMVAGLDVGVDEVKVLVERLRRMH